MAAATRTFLGRRLPRVLSCAVGGHVWDVAPSVRRGSQLECVRCGMRSEAVTGPDR